MDVSHPGPLPPPGPIEGLPRPRVFTVGPRSTHGKVGTYKRGCRCAHCREVWRLTRRKKVAEYRQRVRAATHPIGCMCLGCRRDRGES